MTSLTDFFKDNPKAALGFSGGVDSSYLLYAAKEAGADIRPYFVKSPFQPDFELEDAKRLCKELAIDLKVLNLNVLEDEQIVKNPYNRCYFCKQKIFSRLIEEAKKDGYKLILDGTNASDDPTDRPGYKALRELKVASPLREAGLSKEMIRDLSKKAGLFTWNKPSYSCLATRIPTDSPIKKEILQKIEMAEGELFIMGFSNFRIRFFNGAGRIQFDEKEWDKACSMREQIRSRILPYFDPIFFDTMLRK